MTGSEARAVTYGRRESSKLLLSASEFGFSLMVNDDDGSLVFEVFEGSKAVQLRVSKADAEHAIGSLQHWLRTHYKKEPRK